MNEKYLKTVMVVKYSAIDEADEDEDEDEDEENKLNTMWSNSFPSSRTAPSFV